MNAEWTTDGAIRGIGYESREANAFGLLLGKGSEVDTCVDLSLSLRLGLGSEIEDATTTDLGRGR